ncbi:unnamed protein product [Polarella glacialis]|uniref:Uncharacterized protein n=1 Tax=Polarella glacialis TaxID=89957 RepID=A0A813K4P9_POLGL|nr:unnamed protein product [Polarella glacialis]
MPEQDQQPPQRQEKQRQQQPYWQSTVFIPDTTEIQGQQRQLTNATPSQLQRSDTASSSLKAAIAERRAQTARQTPVELAIAGVVPEVADTTRSVGDGVSKRFQMGPPALEVQGPRGFKRPREPGKNATEPEASEVSSASTEARSPHRMKTSADRDYFGSKQQQQQSISPSFETQLPSISPLATPLALEVSACPSSGLTGRPELFELLTELEAGAAEQLRSLSGKGRWRNVSAVGLRIGLDSQEWSGAADLETSTAALPKLKALACQAVMALGLSLAFESEVISSQATPAADQVAETVRAGWSSIRRVAVQLQCGQPKVQPITQLAPLPSAQAAEDYGGERSRQCRQHPSNSDSDCSHRSSSDNKNSTISSSSSSNLNSEFKYNNIDGSRIRPGKRQTTLQRRASSLEDSDAATAESAPSASALAPAAVRRRRPRWRALALSGMTAPAPPHSSEPWHLQESPLPPPEGEEEEEEEQTEERQREVPGGELQRREVSPFWPRKKSATFGGMSVCRRGVDTAGEERLAEAWRARSRARSGLGIFQEPGALRGDVERKRISGGLSQSGDLALRVENAASYEFQARALRLLVASQELEIVLVALFSLRATATEVHMFNTLLEDVQRSVAAATRGARLNVTPLGQEQILAIT